MPQIQKISAYFSLLAITFFKRLLKSVPIIPYYKGDNKINQEVFILLLCLCGRGEYYTVVLTGL